MAMGKYMMVLKKRDGVRRRAKLTETPKGVSYCFGLSSSKGQMFIIASIVILVGLIMLKNMFGIYATAEEGLYHDTDIMERQLRNIKGEYERIISTASSGSQYIFYLAEFSSIVPGRILYMLVLTNGTDYNVTIGNFLGDKINCTLNTTGSVPEYYYIGCLENGEYTTRVFKSAGGLINLTLSYEKRGLITVETIPIVVNEKYVMGFLDIAMEKRSMLVRTKDTYKVMWK